MNIPRMKKLLEILREVQAKNLPFDMGVWIDTQWIPKDVKFVTENECGAACCAIGWYCLLAKDELELARSPSEPKYIGPQIKGHPLNIYEASVKPIAEHFGISPAQASHLFMEEGYFDEAEFGDGTKSGFPPVPIDWVIERVESELAGAKP